MNFFIFFIFGVIAVIFFGNTSAHGADSDIVISEVQIAGEKADDEFILLFNTQGSAVDLSGYRLSKKILSNSACKESAIVSEKAFVGTIPPQGSFRISHPAYKEKYAADLTYSSPSYYLTDNVVVLLYDNNKNLVTRKDIGNACDKEIIPDPPSPAPDPTPAPEPSHSLIRFNEVFPNPTGNEQEQEFIELVNLDTENADMKDFTIRDASKNGVYTFANSTPIAAGGLFVLKRNISKLSLNNSNETLSLYDSSKVQIDSLQYEKTKEGVSLNRSASGWRGGKPSPGQPNVLNSLPKTKERVPKKGYRHVPVPFDARGKDPDGDSLKFTWNFGDGHKSYKGKTSHTYTKNGDYIVTLLTTDGSEDVVETFPLEIESYPEPKVRIVALVPNPSGKDSDGEWIEIENREKKQINLKNFSIATGTKKLVNHPIREDFFIDGKKTSRLTREVALFSLPNKNGKIELRSPDGKTLQKIKYTSSSSIAEDVVYKKEKGVAWQWQTGTKTNPVTDNEIIAESAPLSLALEKDETVNTPSDEASTPEIQEESGAVDNNSRKAYMRLLNYGTSVTLPKDITLSFPSDTLSLENMSTIELSEENGSLFEKINSYVNDWQNEQ